MVKAVQVLAFEVLYYLVIKPLSQAYLRKLPHTQNRPSQEASSARGQTPHCNSGAGSASRESTLWTLQGPSDARAVRVSEGRDQRNRTAFLHSSAEGATVSKPRRVAHTLGEEMSGIEGNLPFDAAAKEASDVKSSARGTPQTHGTRVVSS